MAQNWQENWQDDHVENGWHLHEFLQITGFFFEEDQVRNNIKNLQFLSATDSYSSVFEEIVIDTKDPFGVQLCYQLQWVQCSFHFITILAQQSSILL